MSSSFGASGIVSIAKRQKVAPPTRLVMNSKQFKGYCKQNTKPDTSVIALSLVDPVDEEDDEEDTLNPYDIRDRFPNLRYLQLNNIHSNEGMLRELMSFKQLAHLALDEVCIANDLNEFFDMDLPKSQLAAFTWIGNSSPTVLLTAGRIRCLFPHLKLFKIGAESLKQADFWGTHLKVSHRADQEIGEGLDEVIKTRSHFRHIELVCDIPVDEVSVSQDAIFGKIFVQMRRVHSPLTLSFHGIGSFCGYEGLLAIASCIHALNVFTLGRYPGDVRDDVAVIQVRVVDICEAMKDHLDLEKAVEDEEDEPDMHTLWLSLVSEAVPSKHTAMDKDVHSLVKQFVVGQTKEKSPGVFSKDRTTATVTLQDAMNFIVNFKVWGEEGEEEEEEVDLEQDVQPPRLFPNWVSAMSLDE